MMPSLVPPDKIGDCPAPAGRRYAGGILSLILVLGFLAANPETERTLFGFNPLFGLDPVTHQGHRITGPLTGLWSIIFVLPMFLLTPDYPAKRRIGQALREGLTEVETNARRIAETTIDGGISARQHDLHRRPGVAVRVRRHLRRQHLRVEHDSVGTFGILLAIAGTFGAWLGGKLDDKLGPKRVIAGSS